MYNGYKNRVTWAYNLHNDPWTENNQDRIIESVESLIQQERLSFDSPADFKDNLYGILTKVIRELLESDLDLIVQTIDDMFARSRREFGDSFVLMIDDLIDYQGIIKNEIDVYELTELYAEQFMDELRNGAFSMPTLDDLLQDRATD